jgi:DNA polymerase-3 subunit chi
MADPTEVLFYQLDHQPLDRVLPQLVERTLQRNWRAVVQAGSPERVEALDLLLWTWRDDSFLPHGTAKDGAVERQPVFLTSGPENPNGASVRFLVDGAEIERFAGYQRIVLLFEGRDEEARARARQGWAKAKSQGCAVTYWQQADSGRWERKA